MVGVGVTVPPHVSCLLLMLSVSEIMQERVSRIILLFYYSSLVLTSLCISIKGILTTVKVAFHYKTISICFF
jgi:hypothetical protein